MTSSSAKEKTGWSIGSGSPKCICEAGECKRQLVGATTALVRPVHPNKTLTVAALMSVLSASFSLWSLDAKSRPSRDASTRERNRSPICRHPSSVDCNRSCAASNSSRPTGSPSLGTDAIRATT
eukprot:1395988-Prymnesium_polylepis.1